MTRRFVSVFILIIVLSCLSGCDKILPAKKPVPMPVAPKSTVAKQAPIKGEEIASINGYKIGLEDLEDEINQFNAAVPADRPELKIDTADKKIEYLKNELMRRILLYQEGLKRGIDKEADVRKAIEKAKQQMVVFQLIKQLTEKVEVSSTDIEEYYNRFKDQLKTPEERKIREIVVSSQSQAKDLLIKILQGEDFSTLAMTYSKAASAKKGGDLGFIKPGEKFSAFDEVAFSNTLEVNQVSNAFKGKDGYYIIKLEAVKGGETKTLTELWENIKRTLTFIKQQQAIEELVGKLSIDAKIEIQEDKIQ